MNRLSCALLALNTLLLTILVSGRPTAELACGGEPAECVCGEAPRHGWGWGWLWVNDDHDDGDSNDDGENDEH